MLVMWLVPIAGLVVIAFTLRETFQDLFQPSASGSLSAWIGRATFSVSKRISFSSPFCRRSGDTVHNRFLEHAGGDRIRHALLAKRARWVQHANVNTPRCNVTVWNCHFLLFRYAGNSRSRRHDAKHKLDPCIVRHRGVIRILFANG